LGFNLSQGPGYCPFKKLILKSKNLWQLKNRIFNRNQTRGRANAGKYDAGR
jgi:hypothetical protein